jgi:hypothetical protein
MNKRPDNVAPGGMGGATRMQDPSEAAHDRMRRRLMNVALVVVVLLNVAQIRYVGVHGWDWVSAGLMAAAAMPAALAIKVFELRFKMAADERRQVLGQVSAAKYFAYAVLAAVAFVLGAPFATWALLGIWGCDFFTYYRDRPERLRHLYAVTKTLEELRDFPAPWAWPLPAIVFEVARRLLERQ